MKRKIILSVAFIISLLLVYYQCSLINMAG